MSAFFRSVGKSHVRAVCAQLGTARPYTPASAFWDCAHRSPRDWAHTCPHLHRDLVDPPPTSATGLSRSVAPRKSPSRAHICTATESIASPTSAPPLPPSGTSASAQQHRCDAAAKCVGTIGTVLQPSATGERSRCGQHMLQPTARYRAAVPLAASDPIQAREAKAPPAESRGVCAALTGIGVDVSEAVPFDCPEYSIRRQSTCYWRCEDSVDVRVASFGSEQSRPTSALRLGLGLRVGPRTRAQHGPTVIRRLPRGDGE